MGECFKYNCDIFSNNKICCDDCEAAYHCFEKCSKNKNNCGFYIKNIELTDDDEKDKYSDNYKERFRAEYHQVNNRYQKLKSMIEDWDNEKLNFKPLCPRKIYDLQLKSMHDYLAILEARALIENISL